MKIFRYRGMGHSYGYIRANFFERIYLRGRAAGGDTGIYCVRGWRGKPNGMPPGPASHGAEFVIRAKQHNTRCQDFVYLKKRRLYHVPTVDKNHTWNLFVIEFDLKVRRLEITKTR